MHGMRLQGIVRSCAGKSCEGPSSARHHVRANSIDATTADTKWVERVLSQDGNRTLDPGPPLRLEIVSPPMAALASIRIRPSHTDGERGAHDDLLMRQTDNGRGARPRAWALASPGGRLSNGPSNGVPRRSKALPPPSTHAELRVWWVVREVLARLEGGNTTRLSARGRVCGHSPLALREHCGEEFRTRSDEGRSACRVGDCWRALSGLSSWARVCAGSTLTVQESI